MVHQVDTKGLLGRKLITWWRIHGRRYPWRTTKKPYHILVSETLLHRTRADQVAKVYQEFVKLYPMPGDLARADPASVYSLLGPLGLRWRTKLLIDLAIEIHNHHDGLVPDTLQGLQELPGVSDYIASSVLCFAFGKAVPILDTNTVRITGRVFGKPVSDAARRSKEFRALYNSILDTDHAREFNLAMIDLGALVCRPKSPKCGECPISGSCSYAKERI